jgi:hypothetical protein
MLLSEKPRGHFVRVAIPSCLEACLPRRQGGHPFHFSNNSQQLKIPKNRKFSIFVIFRGYAKNNKIIDFWFFGTAD